ncbi:MAG: DUF4085 family protein [Bacilli bacterium]|nr:DUF4085 family protein [Bacilli bacterium]
MRVHKGVEAYDDALYLRLYKRKEKEFVHMQRQIYDVDPRFILEQDGCTLVPLDKFVNGEEINEDDKVIYQMPTEEKDRILKLIDEYDVRPPFDEKKCKEEFRILQETTKKATTNKLPSELLHQISDIRIFTLGYCTKEIFKKLKKISYENKKKTDSVFHEYIKSQKEELIPQTIRERFGFHDCEVIELTGDKKDLVMLLNTQGGFTNFNMITFTAAEIIKEEEHIEGSIWIYHELYTAEKGYEAHILFWAQGGLKELIIRCKDIIINKSETVR